MTTKQKQAEEGGALPATVNQELLVGGQFNWRDAATLDVFKKTKAVGLSEGEQVLALEYCKATGLNPFRNEIWFIASTYTKKNGEQARQFTIMTGVNGFLSLANKHPQYDGMEHEVELVNGKPVSAWCKVYRKDRSRPHMCRVYFAEYDRSAREPYGNWAKMPITMIEKVAICRALREAFPQDLGSIYGDAEMSARFSDAFAGEAIDAEFEPVANRQPVPEPKAHKPMPGWISDLYEDPSPAQPEPPRSFLYDLDSLDEPIERKREIWKLLTQKHGAVVDQETGFVRTKTACPELKDYLVEPPKMEAEPEPKPAPKLQTADEKLAELNARARKEVHNMENR